MKKFLLKIDGLSKSFSQPDNSELKILENLNLNIEAGSITAITGVSGSGKSTLLHLIGGFDKPNSGSIFFESLDINKLKRNDLAKYRNRDIGFVYQFHYLLPELKIKENIAFPFLINSFDKTEAFKRAEILLKEVGMEDKAENLPYQLSGGERQRVAIARSLINKPKLLLADEPTGNLDSNTGKKIFSIFKDLIKKDNFTAIIVTHNEDLANMCDSIYHLSEKTLIPVKTN